MARFIFIIALLALTGLLVSGFVASGVYTQERAIEQDALAREIDTHTRLVQDRLSERELLTRVSVGLIRSDAALQSDVLKPLRASIYAFKADFVAATWIARLQPSDIARADATLAQSGFAQPRVRNYDDSPLPAMALDGPIDVLMDIEPRNAQTIALPGRRLDQALLGTTLANAAVGGEPTASDPIVLPRTGNSMGIVLVAPVYRDGVAEVLGFITFSYRIGPLLLANDETSLFKVVLRDPANRNAEIFTDKNGVAESSSATASSMPGPILKKVVFGGRDWTLGYYPLTDPVGKAYALALLTALAGLGLTALVCGLFGYVAYNNLRLSREIVRRSSFEDRLGAVIAELNHRVKNILAVTQSIVTRTLRPGVDIDIARELLIGRIHAMSHVVSLLSDSHWQGVKLPSLLNSSAIPHADRIVASGPEITVSARSAQSLSLLFFELASHAADGPVSGSQRQIVAQWSVSGEEPDAVFHLRWEEFNATPATRHEDTDFGVILLDRVAPEALGGTSKRYFTDVSYVYELTAKMESVVDRTEMLRTGRLSLLPPGR